MTVAPALQFSLNTLLLWQEEHFFCLVVAPILWLRPEVSSRSCPLKSAMTGDQPRSKELARIISS